MTDDYGNQWDGVLGQRRVGEVAHAKVKKWCRLCGCRLNSYNETSFCSPCKDRRFHVKRIRVKPANQNW